MTPWTVAREPFDSPVALDLWRAYYTEVSDRWFLLHEGRRTPPPELERGLAAETGSELAPPHGALLVAWYGGEAVGCAGVRPAPEVSGEYEGAYGLTRVYLRPGHRGKGGAALLLAAVEDTARSLGARRLVLDTRHDLTEARALYARHGYTETGPLYRHQYAEHWFHKALDAPGRGHGALPGARPEGLSAAG
ncbi:GNAT family N-acetyltransferase [Streptomyces sp. NPDC049954]|uniref:GNAT family N-acetyltransferase n=1 Tax=Streptomyces sp. NPDC049954 TaxID=3155779 RepID=UPI00343CFCDB